MKANKDLAIPRHRYRHRILSERISHCNAIGKAWQLHYRTSVSLEGSAEEQHFEDQKGKRNNREN